jgi:hypothetical protein
VSQRLQDIQRVESNDKYIQKPGPYCGKAQLFCDMMQLEVEAGLCRRNFYPDWNVEKELWETNQRLIGFL